MKVAIDQNGNLAYINQAATNQSFFCPECQQPLIVKTSKKAGNILHTIAVKLIIKGKQVNI